MDSIKISFELPVSAEELYNAWLDSHKHSQFTGGEALIDPNVDGRYTAWDGYIRGVTLELQKPNRIVQSWRTLEFPPDAPDSRLEVSIDPTETGSKITLAHSNLQPGDGKKYELGWNNHYLEPMQAFFEE